MDFIAFARVVHVLAIVLWIGGVAMVTTVLIPTVRRLASGEDQVQTFEKLEERFAKQARIWVLTAGLSGFFLLYALDGWSRYLDYRYWWIHAMTGVWLVFSLVLYVLEPFVLHRLFRKYMKENPEKAMRIIHRAHWILLLLSLITIAGAVAGSHGWFLIR